MRTTRILKGISAAVAILTAIIAVALFALQGQTNAIAESPALPPAADITAPTAPTPPVPPVIEPPAIEAPPVAPPTTAPPTTAPPTSAPSTTAPSTTAPPTTGESTDDTPVDPGPTPGTLRPGDEGPAVLALQQRLRSLGYWLGTPDGAYGGLTVQAVMAFQKVEGMERDGIAGPGTAAALDGAVRPQAAGSGDLVEVDKDRQVLFVVRGGEVEWVLNVSTGTEEPYEVNGRTELADTPAGEWEVAWTHDGVDEGELGSLYRPRYFHSDGIAVHGSPDVPAYPASHGCVRVTNPAMDWIWSEGIMPIGSLVWIY